MSPDQRGLALQRANEIRIDRARIKRELKRGERSIGETLLDPPECLNTMSIEELLLVVPRCRRGDLVGKLLSRVPVSPTRAILALTKRQRRVIVDDLEET